MPHPKRIVLFVEGPGDVLAAPVLAHDIFSELACWEHAFLDPNCMRVGDLGSLLKNEGEKWIRLLGTAAKRPRLGGVLLFLDGDTKKIGREPFCAVKMAKRLVKLSEISGAGTLFSVACVFARREFESWIIACADAIANVPLVDGRILLPTGFELPQGDLEEHPRDAKGWLDERMPNGYSETQDQVERTRLMTKHKPIIRNRMRSFRRFEKAMADLVQGIRSGVPIVSPVAS